MNYEEMSDEQINLAVKQIEIGKYSNYVGYIDYCNNPSAAWPIIFESRIHINPYYSKDNWFVGSDQFEISIDTDNPLRAAMICFLKMKDAEK